MFKITQGRGFHITFANGYTVSVQWGIGNYCHEQHHPQSGNRYSETAEVAYWHESNGELISFGTDTVEGWKSADEVASFLANVAAMPIPVAAIGEGV